MSVQDRARGVVADAPARPPRFVQNERGEVVEVLLSYDDYKDFLRILAAHADWETLPPYLQDAIDRLLAVAYTASSLGRHPSPPGGG